MRASQEIPFRFELPVDVWEKSGEAGKERRIGGIVSTETRDRQGEIVLQRGLKFDEFLSNGWFNDNHSKNTTDILGYPTKVERVTHNGKPAHRVEGYLLSGYKPADKIWELAQSLKRTNRRLGFSIEGGVRQRMGPNNEVIAEAVVRNVAITTCPVNTDTGLDVLAKSLQAIEQGVDKSEVARALDVLQRALTAGGAISAPAEAAPGDGFALRTESLEGTRRRKRRRLSKSEAVAVVQRRYPGMTREGAQRILRWVTKGTNR